MSLDIRFSSESPVQLNGKRNEKTFCRNKERIDVTWQTIGFFSNNLLQQVGSWLQFLKGGCIAKDTLEIHEDGSH